MRKTSPGGTTTKTTPEEQVSPGMLGCPLHELLGEVEVSNHPDIAVGDMVVGWASNSNGLTEKVITHGEEVWRYDIDLPPHLAISLQPLACVIEASRSRSIAGVDVAIIGLGPIGLLFAHVARDFGARSVVGIDPVDRSDIASTFGLDEVVVATSAQWYQSLTDAQRPGLIIEAVGHQTQTVNDALGAVAEGGTVLCFGIPDDDIYPIEFEKIIRRKITMTGGTTRQHRVALRGADEYTSRYRDLPAQLVSHRFGVTEVQEAYQTAVRQEPGRLKVVIS
jgi:threonine dehydrogenase-like Zn-dependent dehydrogenase